jgi:hypothetical protein
MEGTLMANPGYSRKPDRTAPARKNQGRGSNAEPTSPSDQNPSEIFGIPTSNQSTGLGGSAGRGAPGDVTQQSDQTKGFGDSSSTDPGTTLDGSAGASVPTGGSSVSYTDPFAIMGADSLEGAQRTAQGQIDGSNDWTQFAAKYDHGPTLPGLEGNRPTTTGVEGLNNGSVTKHRVG